MTVIIDEGFEDGTTDAWTKQTSAGCSLTVDGNVVKTGHYSLNCYIDGSHTSDAARIFQNRTNDQFWIKQDVRFSDIPTSSGQYIEILQPMANGTEWVSVCYLRAHHDGTNVKWRLWWYEDGEALQDAYSTSTVVADTFYCATVLVKMSNTVGNYQVWINGVKEIDTGDVDNVTVETGANVDRIWMGDGGGWANERTTYLDCIVVDDTSRPDCAVEPAVEITYTLTTP